MQAAEEYMILPLINEINNIEMTKQRRFSGHLRTNNKLSGISTNTLEVIYCLINSMQTESQLFIKSSRNGGLSIFNPSSDHNILVNFKYILF